MGKGTQGYSVEVTQQQLDRLDAIKQLVDAYPQSASHFNASDSNHRLFFVSFDGTGNDRAVDGPLQTNPAHLQQMVKDSGQPNVIPHYIEGVGTGGAFDEIIGGATGYGVVAKAEEAYTDFKDQVIDWHNDNPDTEVHLSMAGFSRGTGSERHFANLVYDRGIPHPDAEATTSIIGWDDFDAPIEQTSYDRYLIAPGEIQIDAMLIYDSVITGQELDANMGIPPVADLNVLHIVAENDYRQQFSLHSIIDPDNPGDPRLLEVLVAGAHSNVGGSYENGGIGIEAHTLEIGHSFLASAGVPIADIPQHLLPDLDAELLINDSDSWLFSVDPAREINYHSNEAVDPETLASLYEQQPGINTLRQIADSLHLESSQNLSSEDIYNLLFEYKNEADPENDGTGIWNGAVDFDTDNQGNHVVDDNLEHTDPDFDNADFDTINASSGINGLVWNDGSSTASTETTSTATSIDTDNTNDETFTNALIESFQTTANEGDSSLTENVISIASAGGITAELLADLKSPNPDTVKAAYDLLSEEQKGLLEDVVESGVSDYVPNPTTHRQ